MPEIIMCSIPDCGQPTLARGWCGRHYERWRAHGDPLIGRRYADRGTPLRFILDVAVPCITDECLPWPFARISAGYANIRHEGRNWRASRLVCTIRIGPAPTPEHDAAHTCGKGHEGCINGSHLVWKTHVENEADKLIHGTLTRGERQTTAKLTEAQACMALALKGKMSQREIGEMLGVGQPAISHIHTGRSWGWLA